ncbi:olfactory receptor 6C74-like [Choloepus didactylus]|uniref:olfactory receptor 6C74-like n=1 Tax=Choloepus didactylus TaxID=27675 RepID=UPI0018A04877|nr:olfactory receptor 6C74-like [Choloepus didactylus]
MGNHTRVTVLAGLTADPQLKVVLFIFLFLTYLFSITGNLIIITLTLLDMQLKTPMYFFLQNFSILEIFFTATCILKLLVMMASGDKNISYNCCVTQLLFVILLGESEFYLLAAMSCDLYVAICKALHYTTIMNSKICIQLVLSCWLDGFFSIFPGLVMGLNLDFCTYNVSDHFICDTFLLLQISCSDTWLIKIIVFISALVTLLVTLVMVITSRTYIALMILKIPSSNHRRKAFCVCSSQMIVISLSYGSCISLYIKPSAKQRLSFHKRIVVLYTSVAPLLNPFIYTLRNQPVKKSFMNIIYRVFSFSNK